MAISLYCSWDFISRVTPKQMSTKFWACEDMKEALHEPERKSSSLEESVGHCTLCDCNQLLSPDPYHGLPGDTGSGPSSRNASVERGGERQSDTSDSETTDIIRRINQQPFNREGQYDPNR